MTARLLNQTALITGSTDGVGVGIATAFAAEGAHVLVSGRHAIRGAAVVETIRSAGGRADFVAADLGAGRAAITQLVTEVTRLIGGTPDVLVNNAAMLLAPTPTGEVTEDVIDQALAVNIKAAFILTGLIAPTMAARGSGAIVNIGSINGLVGMPGSALYSTTKAAMHSLTKSWAAEFGPSGVRVNAVAPGPTLTERNVAFADHIAPILATLPSRRASTVAEVAAAVVFLASAEAANVHGAILSVDGGFSAV